MSKKRNPIVGAALGVVNGIVGLIADKKKGEKPKIKDLIDGAVTFSSKRITGYGLGGTIIMIAVKDIVSNGINTGNGVVLGVGALLIVATQFFTNQAEK